MRSHIGRRHSAHFIATVLILASAGLSRAADVFWNNAAGGDWATGGNWSTGSPPGAADNAFINLAGSYTVTLRGARSVNQLTIGNAGAALRIEGSAAGGTAQLTVANGVSNAGTLILNDIDSTWGAVLTVTNGTLTNTGTIDVQLGANGTRQLNAQLDNQGTASFAKDTTMTRQSSDHLNSGTINVTGGNLTINGGGTTPTFTNSGLLNIASGRSLLIQNQTISLNGSNSVPGSGQFATFNATVNLGMNLTVLSTGTSFQFDNSTINGPGTLRNEGSSQRLALRRGIQLNAPFQNASGAVLRLEGSNAFGTANTIIDNGFTNAGTIELSDIDSTWGALLTITNGTLTNTGAIDVQAGANGSRQVNAQLDNQGTLTVGKDASMNRAGSDHLNSGTINVSGGNLTVNGGGTTPTFTNSGPLNIASGRFVLIQNQTISLNSGSSYPGAGLFATFNATVNLGINLTVMSTGTAFQFDNNTINGLGTLRNEGSSLRLALRRGILLNAPFQNAGGAVLRLEGSNAFGTANTIIDNGFTNAGTIELSDIDSTWGALLTVTNGTLTNTGSIAVQAGANGSRQVNAQLDNQGTLTVGKDTSMSRASSDHLNSGTINVTGGNLTVNGGGATPTFTNSGAFNIAGGRTLLIQNQTISLNSGSFPGAGQFAIFNATLNLGINLTVMSTGTSFQFDNSTINGPGILRNEGSSLRLALRRGIQLNAPFQNASGAVLRLEGSNAFGTANTIIDNGFTNAGTIEMSDLDSTWGALLTVTNGTLTNTGLIDVQPGANGGRQLNAQLDNQNMIAFGKDTLVNRPSSDHVNSGTINLAAGNLSISQGGTTPSFTSSGTIAIPAGRTLSINGGSGMTQTAGLTTVEGTLSVPGNGVTLQGGTLKGNGTVVAVVNNSAGVVSPGLSAGALTITGNYSQGLAGTLEIELGGLTPATQFDQLMISGSATLAGTLRLSSLGGFMPMSADEFAFMTYASRSGAFSNCPVGFPRLTIRYEALRAVLLFSTGGDMNCDCTINNFDIDAFVLALTSPGAYAMQYPSCDRSNADINDDGFVNNFDIDPFVARLVGG